MAKAPSHKEKIIAFMNKTGTPVTIEDVAIGTGLTKTQVSKRLHGDLYNKEGRAGFDEDTREYWLIAAGPPVKPSGGEAMENESAAPAPKEERRVNLDQGQLFTEQLRSVGVKHEVAPTITEIFFSGNIDDIEWLKEVLHVQAAGWVSHHQETILLSWWAKSRNLELSEEILGRQPKGITMGNKAAPEKETPLTDLGVGWDIAKVDGEWVPIQGGPMSHKEASDRAERRQAMAMVGKQQRNSSPQGNESAAPAERAPSIQDILIEKMIDHFFAGGNKEESVLVAQVQQLQATISEMREQARDAELTQIKNVLGQLMNRDPFQVLQEANQLKAQLGYTDGPVITDQSPAVQLIKDATEKFDKGTSRILGVMERMILKSDEFAPEQTRTFAEQEEKASHILDELQDGEKVRTLRGATFGI